MLLQGRAASVDTHFQHLHNSHEHLLEALQVPVLVDERARFFTELRRAREAVLALNLVV